MNKQEIFDKAMKAQLSQEAFSMHENEDDKTCSYLDGNGNSCMIGHIAKDKRQAGQWESKLSTVSDCLQDLGIYDEGLYLFCAEIQETHDQIALDSKYEWDRDYFLSEMNDFAKKHKLDWNY